MSQRNLPRDSCVKAEPFIKWLKEAEEESSVVKMMMKMRILEVNIGEIVKYRVSGKWELQSANIDNCKLKCN